MQITNDNNRYKNGKIYRLVCNTTGLQYYGSTCEMQLCKRLAHHVSEYKRYLNNIKHNYITSFEILKNNNYQIFLVENCSCNSKDELLLRERYNIENNDCVNKYIPLRTINERKKYNIKYNIEYYTKNKDKYKEKNKQYYEKNTEKLKEYKKEYYEKNKDKLKDNYVNKKDIL
jgi:hypothetical protein